MTTSAPVGIRSSRAAARARSRRLVRLRTTAPPTDLETTRPTRGGRPARASVMLAWTTTSREPDRTPAASPLPRSAAENSARVRSRCPAGSTGRASGGQLGATLAAASREDGATGAGPHAQAEAVGLGPATVVRLESTLAHECLRNWSGPVGLSTLVVVRWLAAAVARRASAAIGNPRGGARREPPPGSRACENGRQAASTVRERTVQGQTSRTTRHTQRTSTRAGPMSCGTRRDTPRKMDFWVSNSGVRVADAGPLLLASHLVPSPPTGCG